MRNISLTNQLISGPDLINVGVLTRFREEKNAIIEDVETTFQKVRVPEDQRSLLRFFWWENGDIRNPIKDHEIYVHLFGGISSRSCSNYALKQTSVDNEKNLGLMQQEHSGEMFMLMTC